ncbi:MAG: hypothetical protein CSA13_01035 [Clostridiales bacterium]|nr:MAG: hypothetical protein CSA13_01035 [Clostridiales bacterium]
MKLEKIKDFLAFRSSLTVKETIFVLIIFAISGLLFHFIKVGRGYFYSGLIALCAIIIIRYIHFKNNKDY